MLSVSALNTTVHNYVVPTKIVEKFSFNEFKIEKVKFFIQVQPKFFALTFLTSEFA